MQLRYKIWLTVIMAGLFLPFAAYAGNIRSSNSTARFYDDHSQINLGLAQGDVRVHDDRITGYAWSENWGWINFSPAGYGVENDGDGNLSGYAWGENLGWINFNPTHGGVSITGGDFHGFAWSENGGWIQFDCAFPNACVQTTWPGEDEPDPEPEPPGGGGGTTILPPDPDPEPEEPVVPPIEPETPPTVEPEPEPEPEEPEPTEVEDEPEPTEGGDREEDLEPEPEEPEVVVPGVVDPEEPRRPRLLRIIPGPVASVATAIAGGVVGLSSMAASAFLSYRTIGELAFLPQRLWNLLLAIFGFRKKRLPWGTVYDSLTKQPLDPAYVQLLDAETGKETEGAITDLDGRFGFLPEAGRYTIQARKTNYSFPSKRLQGQSSDVLYDSLYFGDEFSIADDSEAVIHNIPLDPVETDWNEVQKRKKGLFNFYSKYDVIIYSISTFLFYLGFIVSLVMAYFYPSAFHFAVAIVYIVLIVLRAVTTAPQKLGSLRHKDGSPVSYGLVRVYLAGTEQEVKKVVANEYGKFYCLVAPAHYYVKVFERVDENDYKEVFKSLDFHVQNCLIDGKYVVPDSDNL